MSVRFHRGGWEVRWRDAAGRQRARRFQDEDAARAFDAALAEVSPAGPRPDTVRHGRSGGVYSYRTTDGIRWRFVFRRSDGTQTSKRGFLSERAAREARRPAFGARSLGELSIEDIREFMAELAEAVEAEELSPKTANNSLGVLVVCLNAAVEDGLLSTNPALRVQRLPARHVEREYLRLDEIPRYLEACSEIYRPLAELLVGSGLRISEALALRRSDLELEETGGTIVVYRSRKKDTIGSTKSDRFRSVEIGPVLCRVLRDQVARRAELADGEGDNAFLFVMPLRATKTSHGRWESAGVGNPLDRTTVSREWHKQALQDAALRDMPLHALRHSAAAAWLAAGNSLMYVQRQLGHADIGTTERYYGHLERHVLAAGAVATEEAIARAARVRR